MADWGAHQQVHRMFSRLLEAMHDELATPEWIWLQAVVLHGNLRTHMEFEERRALVADRVAADQR